MPLATEKSNVISKQTLVPLGMVISMAAAVIIGGMWVSDAQHKVEMQLLVMNNRISNLEKTVGAFNNVMEASVLQKDFTRWAKMLAVGNPDLNIPEPVD